MTPPAQVPDDPNEPLVGGRTPGDNVLGGPVQEPAAGDAAPDQPGAGEPGPSRLADWLLRLAGAVVALLGGVVAAVWTLLLVPLRLVAGDLVVRLPVAILLAIAGNVALLWFARRATGSRWGVLLPAVGWFAVMLPALGSTTEGDRLLLGNDWVALLTLFAGTITLTIGAVLGAATPRTG